MGQPQEYDATLKPLLRGSAARALREVTGATIGKWLDVELPKVQNLRLDLLGEAEDQTLGDNVIAIVARLRKHKDAARRIVERIAVPADGDRVTAGATTYFERAKAAGGGRRREGGSKDANSYRHPGKQGSGARV